MAGESKVLKAFGARLRRLRLAAGLSQEELSDKCGLDRTYIGGVERGERNLSLLNIVKIAGALRIPASRLMEDRDE
jgi:transcriptional regulator with XRE-family HTH domain